MASLIATGIVGLFLVPVGMGISWVYKVMENC